MPSVVTDPDFELDDESRRVLDEERKSAGRALRVDDMGAAKPPPDNEPTAEAKPEKVEKPVEPVIESKVTDAKAVETPVAENTGAAEGEPEVDEDTPREADGKFTADPKKIREHERAKRKKAQAKAAEIQTALDAEKAGRQKDREEFIALKARLDAMQQFMTQPKSDAVPRQPEPAVAPQTPEEAVKLVLPRIEAIEQRSQLENQVNTLAQTVRAHVSEFTQRQPDYKDAFGHLVQQRRNELTMQGFTPEQVAQQLSVDEHAVAITALQNGKNPAEVLYGLAISRGYKKAEPQQQPVQATPVVPPVVQAQPNLSTIAAGQQAAKSLGGAAGAAPPQALSPQEIVSLSDAEWEKLPLKERMKALRA